MAIEPGRCGPRTPVAQWPVPARYEVAGVARSAGLQCRPAIAEIVLVLVASVFGERGRRE